MRQYAKLSIVYHAWAYALGLFIGASLAIGQSGQNPPIEKLSDSVYRIGTVRLDREKREIYLSGRVNMNRGIVEVVACGPQGKLHESIFVLDVVAHDLQVAMLLLGADSDHVRFSEDGDHLLGGDTVDVFVSWANGGEQISYPAKDLVLSTDGRNVLTLQPWIFLGSRIVDGVFQADVHQSIISTFYEQNPLDAIIACQPAQTIPVTDLMANAKLLPIVDTPIEMSIKIPMK